MNKKVVFFDLDGTLLNKEKKLLESSKIAIKKLQENNILPVIATGRTPAKVQWVFDELNIDSYVAINGQYVVYEGKEIHKEQLDTKFLHDITQFTTSNKHALAYVSLSDVKSSIENHPYIKNVYEPHHMPYPSFGPNHYHTNPIYQLLLFCQDPDQTLYQERYGDKKFVRWHPFVLDVLPNGVSKATGITKFLEIAGIQKENTYAFGDDINDIEMFSLVGSTVAMRNAIPELKRISDFVTSSNEEDGILNGLKTLQLI
ncbi:Cof-type HAD-IIB family hydrolase [Robertmurraya sp. FSL R5-0851]|uniref:Cof-type HAD-IIB family hydrolase n=1 Tax=Robertmurraya sp. FSL R5-0851 TaxID=2921584 RepID=UPI0030FA6E8F